jgi:hypothetical protein
LALKRSGQAAGGENVPRVEGGLDTRG